MDEIFEKIEGANETEIECLLEGVIKRYNALYPDWEIMYVSISRKPEERERQVESLISFLQTQSEREKRMRDSIADLPVADRIVATSF